MYDEDIRDGYTKMLERKIPDHRGRTKSIMSHLNDARKQIKTDIAYAEFIAGYLIENYPQYGDGYDLNASIVADCPGFDFQEIERLYLKAINCEFNDIMTPIFFVHLLGAVISYEPDNNEVIKKYNSLVDEYSHLTSLISDLDKSMLAMLIQTRNSIKRPLRR